MLGATGLLRVLLPLTTLLWNDILLCPPFSFIAIFIRFAEMSRKVKILIANMSLRKLQFHERARVHFGIEHLFIVPPWKLQIFCSYDNVDFFFVCGNFKGFFS